MSLLEFARGPAMQIAIAVFVFGVAWRLLSILLLPRLHDQSQPRPGTRPAIVGAGWEIVKRSWPRPAFAKSTLFSTVNGYVFHLGLAIVVFGFAQHIIFLKNIFGVSWPGLPANVIALAGIITLGSLTAALVRRLASPVLRLISTANDYFTWLVTVLPLLTGLLAVAHLGGPYETLLALHILSISLLLIWFPFGKLMHAFLVFLTRGETGAFYARRGVEL
ncbi:MAG: hypothetical protein P4M09_15115 [Devosia sp.]|nr:hypothetical protein [Devosia sp.]